MRDKADSEVFLPMTEQTTTLMPPNKGPPFKTPKSSAHGTISGHRASSTSNMSVSEVPITYEGVEIKTYDDLLDNFRLETFEETMAKKTMIDPVTG